MDGTDAFEFYVSGLTCFNDVLVHGEVPVEQKAKVPNLV